MRITLLWLTTMVAAQTPSLYDYFPTGDTSDVSPKTQNGLLLSGGGGDVDEAFQWFLRKAGGGDIVVLRASGSDGYNKYLPTIGTVNSVETFVTKSRQASFDRFLLEKLWRAEAIFIAGGDQWNYLRMWKGTPVQDALNRHYRKRRPIGGTSAGLAVLGEFSFSAEHDTVTSEQVLLNPFHRNVTIEDDFLKLPVLRHTITDSHFAARNRMGRLIVFLARMLDIGRRDARGIGIDEGTAVTVEGNGNARVSGKGSGYFLLMRPKRKISLPEKPLSVENVDIQRVKAGHSFDFQRWEGGESYSVSIDAGTVRSRRQDGRVY